MCPLSISDPLKLDAVHGSFALVTETKEEEVSDAVSPTVRHCVLQPWLAPHGAVVDGFRLICGGAAHIVSKWSLRRRSCSTPP